MIQPALVKEFAKLVGPEAVFSAREDLATYSYDAAVLDPVMPALAVRPASVETLGQVVRLAGQNGLPVTVRGSDAGPSKRVVSTTGPLVKHRGSRADAPASASP